MLTHVIHVCLGATVKLFATKRLLVISRPAGSEDITVDQWNTLTKRLSDAATNHADVRVYLVAGNNLHFAYDLPRLETDDDRRAAVAMKLKKDLLFSARDFVFAYSTVVHERGSTVQVAGVRRTDLHHAMTASKKASLDVHRVFFRDQLIEAALAARSPNEGPTVFVLEDDGFLVVDERAGNQRLNRFPVVDQQDRDRRLTALVRHLETSIDEGTCLVDDALVDELKGRGFDRGKPLSTLARPRDLLVNPFLDAPGTTPASVPFSQVTSEEELGFRPTKAHVAGLLVAVYLFWCLIGCYLRQGKLETEAADIAAAAQQVETANRTIDSCNKRSQQLQGVEKAFALFDGEGFSTLRLIAELSGCRPDGTLLVSLQPSKSNVTIKARAQTKQDVFTFVQKLSASSFFEEATLREMTFQEGGSVFFVVELVRNG